MSMLIAGLLGAATEYNNQLDLQAQAKAEAEKAKQAAKLAEQERVDTLMGELALAEITAGQEELAGLKEDQRGLDTAATLVQRAKEAIPMTERNKYLVYWDGSKVVTELKEEFKPKTGKDKDVVYGPYSAITSQVDIPGGSEGDFYPEYIRIVDQETYNTALQNEGLEVGVHISPYLYNKKSGGGSFRARDNMRSYTNWLFDDGALEKAIALADQGDSKPLQRLISIGKTHWEEYSREQSNQYALDEKTRVAPSLIEFDNRYKDPRVAGGKESLFFREFVASSFDQSLYSVEQAAAKLGLPLNQITDVETDDEGEPLRLIMDTEQYADFDSWAVENGSYRQEVVDAVYEVARLSGGALTPTQVRASWNSLGVAKGRMLFKTIQESREYFSKPENELVQYNQGRLKIDRRNLTSAPFYNKIGTIMSSLDQQPDLKFAFAKAIIGEDVINTIPGTQRSGNIDRAQEVALTLSPNEKGRDGHAAMAVSGQRLSTTLTDLIDLIENEKVYAGISGSTLIFADGFVAQATNILNQINPGLTPEQMQNEDERAAYNEFIALRKEVLEKGKNVSAEVMFQALSRAALYDVASMLQGGDFRNISDYDVKLSGERLGGIFGNFIDLQKALPTLKHLRDDSREMFLMNDAFANGRMEDVAAAAIVFSHRRATPRTASTYLNIIPGVDPPSNDAPLFYGQDIPLPGATQVTPDQANQLGFGS